MMNYQYELNNGSYYLVDLDAKPNCFTGRREIILMTDIVAIAFDRDDGTRHKHGRPEIVEKWACDARQKLRDGGFPNLADNIVVVSGMLPLDELNKCISITGYCKVLYEKLSTLLPATPTSVSLTD